MKRHLELHLTLGAGHEAECARFLREQVGSEHWPILAALAAEIVSIHEAETCGAVVVVAGPSQVERVLSDLKKSG